jgi:hypothetical protein
MGTYKIAKGLCGGRSGKYADVTHDLKFPERKEKGKGNMLYMLLWLKRYAW